MKIVVAQIANRRKWVHRPSQDSILRAASIGVFLRKDRKLCFQCHYKFNSKKRVKPVVRKPCLPLFFQFFVSPDHSPPVLRSADRPPVHSLSVDSTLNRVLPLALDVRPHIAITLPIEILPFPTAAPPPCFNIIL